MSEQNVERIRRAFDAFNRRDLDGFLALIDPEAEFTTRYMEMEGDPYYRGHAGVREWWRTLLAIFPDFNVEFWSCVTSATPGSPPCASAATASIAVCPSRRRCGLQASGVTAE
jgi:ketosteroid isomerase-like protein